MTLRHALALRAESRHRRLHSLGRVRLEEHEIVSRLVEPCHDGVRLAHLSDLHLAAGLRPRRLLRAIELVNRLRPDLVLITGDFVCASVRPTDALSEALRHLRVPAWATLGNHDYWSGAEQVERAVREGGVQVLRNSRATIELRGAPLHLIGVDDFRTGHSDVAAAFAGLEPGGTRVVLTHDPNVADDLVGHGAALIVAGHTHGGQIRVPGLTREIAKRIGVKYLAGFFQLGETRLYVNRGLGAAVPLRLAAPMEIALLTLRTARLEPAEPTRLARI
jgi:predicted MPP superfamily phosphohydrolase